MTNKTIIYNQENSKQTMESKSKKNQMIVGIADKEFKILKNNLKWVKINKNIFLMTKSTKNLQINKNYKKIYRKFYI